MDYIALVKHAVKHHKTAKMAQPKRVGRYATKANGRWKKALDGPCKVCQDGAFIPMKYCARCIAAGKVLIAEVGPYHGVFFGVRGAKPEVQEV